MSGLMIREAKSKINKKDAPGYSDMTVIKKMSSKGPMDDLINLPSDPYTKGSMTSKGSLRVNTPPHMQ